MATESAEEAIGGGPDPEAIAEITKAVMSEYHILRDFTEITEQEAEAMYAFAYGLFDQGQYQRAEKHFEFLCTLDHFAARFWMGLGASRQMLGKFERAIAAYGMAGVHDMGNPVPPLRAAECMAALGNKDDARKALTAVDFWAGDKPQFAEIKARAKLMEQGLGE